MNEKTIELLETLGNRLKQTRLNADLTQQEVADISGLSRTAIEGAEKGKCTLATFINILVALGVDDAIGGFLLAPPVSPVLLAKNQGRTRKRASASKKKTHKILATKDDLGW